MKYLVPFIALMLLGCSTPKKLMKNCQKVGEIVYECEDL